MQAGALLASPRTLKLNPLYSVINYNALQTTPPPGKPGGGAESKRERLRERMDSVGWEEGRSEEVGEEKKNLQIKKDRRQKMGIKKT